MQTALITGATSGIGFEMAKILAERKLNLILASRNIEKLNNIKADFEAQYKININIIEIDLSEQDSAKKVFDTVGKLNIKVDILINNSGFGVYGEHTSIDINKNNSSLYLNIISLTEMCALFGSEMKKNKNGYILNIASTAAYQPTPYIAAYGASKSYVLNFSEALAKELEDYNVSVTCLSPGATKTEFFNVAEIDVTKNSHMKQQASAKDVALLGINAMFKKKLSVIHGKKNRFLAFSNRFAPRKLVATISKNIMKEG